MIAPKQTTQSGWKVTLARLIRNPLAMRLMQVGILVAVPRQRLGANLVAVDEEARVLMLRHVFHPTVPWGLPGGWLKRNEDPAEGVLRELREETGLTAVLGPVVQVSHEKRPLHTSITYMATIQSGTLSLSNEIIEAAWFKREDIPQPQFPNVLAAIDVALDKHQQQFVRRA